MGLRQKYFVMVHECKTYLAVSNPFSNKGAMHEAGPRFERRQAADTRGRNTDGAIGAAVEALWKGLT